MCWCDFHVRGLECNWWLCCRTDGAEDQYSVLINFNTQNSTDNFYKHFNGKQFSSLEVLVVLTLLNLALCLFLLMLWFNFTMDWLEVDIVQGDVCHVRFVEDVHYTQLIEHAHSSVTSLAEQPTCPVCLGMSGYLKQLYIFEKKIRVECSVPFDDWNFESS